MNDDMFLFGLITNAGLRGTHFALKAETVDHVVDNWLACFTGISPERQKEGGLTRRRVEELELMARTFNRLPVFAEECSGGPIARYVVVRNFAGGQFKG